jgi:enoyl-CoA hydratase
MSSQTDQAAEDARGFHIDRDGTVATLVLSNGPANTVDPPLIERLIDVLPEITEDPAVRCVVVRGAGRIFVGGADIRVMRRLEPETYRAMRRWLLVQRGLQRAPKPVIAAMNGHALGGGAELALACDLRILHEHATFGVPELRLGIFPGAGGSQLLPRLVGPHRAKRMMIDGARLTAEQALAEGLVDIVAGPDFEEVVHREAHRLAALPTATIGLIKRAVEEGMAVPYVESLLIEERYVMENLELEDAAEGLQAFLDKRPPRFSGR